MLGKKMAFLRKARGLKQADVSKYLGISRSTYAGYEAETRQPPIVHIANLATFFNVSADYLLGLSEIPRLKMETSNLRTFLELPDINWDGMPLDGTDLRPTVLFYESLIRERKKTENIIQFVNKQANHN